MSMIVHLELIKVTGISVNLVIKTANLVMDKNKLIVLNVQLEKRSYSVVKITGNVLITVLSGHIRGIGFNVHLAIKIA